MSTTSEQRPVNGAATPAVQEPNPFGSQKARAASVEVESQRAIAETQAAMVIAQRFPRDQVSATDRILQAFTRPTLAEKALYCYARGGNDITGPSIRAAEAMAQEWGNLQFGIRELEQRAGASTVEAFCWDVQTNTRSAKVFQVPHVRHTRKGQYRLEDPRDIYELVANQGARRLRACILSIVPSDVIEAAISQAEKTLKTKIKIDDELIASLLAKFEAIGVTRRMLEAKIQRRVESITPALVVRLGGIYSSIEDGMSTVADNFDVDEAPGVSADDATKSRADSLTERLEKKKGDAPPPAAQPETAPPKLSDAEFKKHRDLRGAISKLWEGVDTGVYRAILEREYARNTTVDLTVLQLEDFLERTPDLLPEAPQ